MSSENPRGVGGRQRGRCDVLTSFTRGLEDLSLAEAHRRIALGPPGRPDLYLPRWQRTLVFVLVGAMAASLVVVGIVLRQPGIDQLAVGTTVPVVAPMTIDELAAVARSQPSVAIDEENRYLHLVSDLIPSEAQRADGLVGRRQEQWIAADGSGRLRTLPLPGFPETGDEMDQMRGPGGLTVAELVPAQLADLPVDPKALLAAMATTIDEQVRPEYVVALLTLPTLTPDLRGVLVEALALLGVVPVDDASPADGGTRFTAQTEEGMVEITFDRLTARPTSVYVEATNPDELEPARTAFRLAEVSDL